MTRTFWMSTAGAVAVALAAAPALAAEDEAKDGASLSGYVTVDVIGAVQGGSAHAAREVDKSGVILDFRSNGFTGVFNLMNTSGGQPNNDVGALQGVDNNESPNRRLRLFEAWVQHDLFTDNASLKGGLIDLNGDGEFQVTGASGLLLGPEFGVTTELAGAGPGGPSAYPVSALTLQLEVRPMENTYIRLAGSNAHLGTPFNKPGSLNTSFDQGAIGLVEAGYEKEDIKLAVGGWGFSDKQPDQFTGALKTAGGAYLLAQYPVGPGVAFVRLGMADGDTEAVKSSWAVGMTIDKLGGKDGRQLSFALDGVQLGAAYRAANGPLGRTETRAEITYVQDVGHGVSVQPDVQYIMNPGGDPAAKNAVVLGLRLSKSFGG